MQLLNLSGLVLLDGLGLSILTAEVAGHVGDEGVHGLSGLLILVALAEGTKGSTSVSYMTKRRDENECMSQEDDI